MSALLYCNHRNFDLKETTEAHQRILDLANIDRGQIDPCSYRKTSRRPRRLAQQHERRLHTDR